MTDEQLPSRGVKELNIPEGPPTTLEEANNRADSLLEIINNSMAAMQLPLATALGVLRLAEMDMTLNMAAQEAMETVKHAASGGAFGKE
jgi:hypothetical protein